MSGEIKFTNVKNKRSIGLGNFAFLFWAINYIQNALAIIKTLFLSWNRWFFLGGFNLFMPFNSHISHWGIQPDQWQIILKSDVFMPDNIKFRLQNHRSTSFFWVCARFFNWISMNFSKAYNVNCIHRPKYIYGFIIKLINKIQYYHL